MRGWVYKNNILAVIQKSEATSQGMNNIILIAVIVVVVIAAMILFIGRKK